MDFKRRTAHVQLTKHQHECPCTIPDKYSQQWRVADAFLHPCPDEPHGNQQEQEALKNEAGHPENQVQHKTDQHAAQGFGHTKDWEISMGCLGRGTRSGPALTAEDSGRFP